MITLNQFATVVVVFCCVAATGTRIHAVDQTTFNSTGRGLKSETIEFSDIPVEGFNLLPHEKLFSAECGLYSLAMAIRAIEIEVDTKGLFDSKYLSRGSQCSKPQDILNACENLGIPAIFYPAPTIDGLIRLRSPALLLLDSQRGAGHWVVFLGMDDDRAILFGHADRSYVRNISLSELSAIWLGPSVVISKKRVSFTERARLLFLGFSGYVLFSLRSVSQVGALCIDSYVCVIAAFHQSRNRKLMSECQ